MTDRSIELEIEVAGTPEEVWRAIATGPGVSSWYVPHEIEEREGGAVSASFGPGPEMTIPGRVAAWDPPHRLVIDGGEEAVEGLAFEWLVEAKDGGTCIVRLVNSGFGSGDGWDDQYDAMTDGWGMFLLNLRLHLEHFAGGSAVPMLAAGGATGPREAALAQLVADLGLDTPAVGDHIAATPDGAPSLSGTVVDVTDWRIVMLLDAPLAGTGFIACEGMGDAIATSIWFYLYGDDAAEVAATDGRGWTDWLSRR